MSYNVENLFDTLDDPNTTDEEFTPDGKKNWTELKLHHKLQHLTRILKSVKNTGREPCPDILGLTEVENSYVLKLWKDKYLQECKYQTIVISQRHPDARGIQVALMTKFKLAGKPVSHLVYEGGRYIQENPLLVDGHPLVVFVNHWKSRIDFGNDNGSDKRALGAKKLKSLFQKYQQENPDADLIALGDFNDESENDSLKKFMGTSLSVSDVIEQPDVYTAWESSADLLNSAYFRNTEFPVQDPLTGKELSKEDAYHLARSTYYYSREKSYSQFDHILVSKGLFDQAGLSFVPNSFQVVRYPDFTLNKRIPIPFKNKPHEEDQFIGASDHFPVFARLKIQDEAK